MKKADWKNIAVIIILLVSPLLFFQTSNVQAAVSGDDWPMFHHDLAHTGYSTSSQLTTKPVELWASPKGFGGSPIVAMGYVYIMDSSNLYCIRTSDGHQVWNQSLPSSSSPAFYSGYIYTPLTAYNASTGEMVLNYTNYQGYTSPTVSEDMIYFGSVLGKNVLALNATTGGKIWNYSTEGEVTSSPAVANGRVYFASWDGNIYALDALTGNKIWNFKMNAPSRYMDSSPAISDDRVYISGWDNIYCLDAATGAKFWNYSAQSGLSSPAVSNGVVYVGSFGSKIIALNASTGTHVWNSTEGSSSSPAVAGGIVYIGDSTRMVALNASTGVKIWNYTFQPTEYFMNSSPAIAEGVLYTSSNQALYAFGTPTITSSPSPSQKSLLTPEAAVAIAAVSAVVAIGLIAHFKKLKHY